MPGTSGRTALVVAVVALVAATTGGREADAGEYKVSVCHSDRVFPGTTLLADMSDPAQPRLVEVDFAGTILWQHRVPAGGRGDRSALLDAALLENGHILFTWTEHGIYEIERSGRIVWKHEDRGASHDADRLANGNTIYNRAWQPKGEPVVVEVDREGKTVWSWTGVQDFDRPPFADIDSEGWMHVNAVTRLASGNTLVSIRNFNTLVEVSPAGQVAWQFTFRGRDRRTGLSTDGPIAGARNHEPEVLANGHVLLALREPNRYVEFDPASGAEIWSWSHPEGGRILDLNREANRLPNGNTLGSAGDRLIEIAPDGAIVWQMHAPGGGQPRKFHKAIRIGTDGRTAFGG